MAYGINVYNASGDLQFSTEGSMSCMAARTSGTVNATTAGGSYQTYGWYSGQVSGLGYNPSTNGCMIMVTPNTPSTATYRAWGVPSSDGFFIYSSSAITYKYKIFESADVFVSTSGYGVNVWDTNGTTLIYSSNGDGSKIESVYGVSPSGHTSTNILWANLNSGIYRYRLVPGAYPSGTEYYYSWSAVWSNNSLSLARTGYNAAGYSQQAYGASYDINPQSASPQYIAAALG